MKKYLRKFHTWLGKFLEEPVKNVNSNSLTKNQLKELIEAGYEAYKTEDGKYAWRFANLNFFATWKATESFDTPNEAWKDAWRDWTS